MQKLKVCTLTITPWQEICIVKNRHLKSEYCYLAPLSKKAVSADKAFLQAIINDHNFKSRIQLGGTVRWVGQCKAAVPALRTLEKDLECEARGYRRTSQQTTRKYPKCSFSKDKLLPYIFLSNITNTKMSTTILH